MVIFFPVKLLYHSPHFTKNGFTRNIQKHLLKSFFCKATMSIPVCWFILQFRLLCEFVIFRCYFVQCFLQVKLFARYSLLISFSSLLVTFCLLLVTFCSMLAIFCPLLFTFYLLFITFYLLLVAFCFLFVTFYSLLDKKL